MASEPVSGKNHNQREADAKTSPDVHDPAQDVEEESPLRFSAEEEAEFLAESNTKKTEANKLFSSASYENAITKYEEAASACPHYLDYELAVLQSNVAACHLKLEQWKDAIGSATKALDGLDRAERADKKAAEEDLGKDTAGTDKEKGSKAGAGRAGVEEEDDDDEDVEEEIVSSGAKNSAPAPPRQSVSDVESARRKRGEDILRIRAKALMRRARARSEAAGWANLAGAEEDYKKLATMDNLSLADQRIVRDQLRTLPPRSKAAQEKEMGEMWGKLKDLGNGILKPFGLSTDNFNMVKDEKTGGYSMNFQQN